MGEIQVVKPRLLDLHSMRRIQKHIPTHFQQQIASTLPQVDQIKLIQTETFQQGSLDSNLCKNTLNDSRLIPIPAIFFILIASSLGSMIWKYYHFPLQKTAQIVFFNTN